MLDTHYALDSEVDEEWAVGGRTLSVRRYAEGGAAEPFSGMYSYARWLRHAELVECLTEAGLTVVVDETRQERNGARVLLIAERR
jgi:hypothetical protein